MGLRGEGQGGGDPDGEGGERAKQYLAHTLTRCATDRSGCAWFAATIWTSEISALAATNAPLLDHPSTVWYNDSKGTAMAHEGRRGTSPPPSPSSAEPWGRKCRKSCPRYLSCYCCYRYRYRSRQSGKYQGLVSGARPSVARKMGGPVGRP